MSERKVLNKYYPPDFDPSKIPRLKQKRDGKFGIRLMAPFNMRCNTCGEYIYKGKKFNARKENAEGETYLGLLIFRFYIKCPRCVAEIAFKTDPENTDYTLEAGATRNFEALRTAERLAKQELEEKEEEERNNPMKLLENRTKASLQEMDMIETLEELRELRHKQSSVNLQSVIENSVEAARERERQQRQREEEEDEAYVKSLFGDGATRIVKRLDSDDEDTDDDDKNNDEDVNANVDDGRPRNDNRGSSAFFDEPAAKKMKPLIMNKASDLLVEDVSISSKQTIKPATANVASTLLSRSADTLKSSTTSSLKQKLLTGVIVKPKKAVSGNNGEVVSTGIIPTEAATTAAAAEAVAGTSASAATTADSVMSAARTAGTIASTAGTEAVGASRSASGNVINGGVNEKGDKVLGGLASLASYSSSDSDDSDA